MIKRKNKKFINRRFQNDIHEDHEGDAKNQEINFLNMTAVKKN